MAGSKQDGELSADTVSRGFDGEVGQVVVLAEVGHSDPFHAATDATG